MNTTTVIIGANGFLGRYLCRHFARNGREVVAIARSRKGWSGDGMFLEWDGENMGPWALALEGAELVIRSMHHQDESNCGGQESKILAAQNLASDPKSGADVTGALTPKVGACKFVGAVPVCNEIKQALILFLGIPRDIVCNVMMPSRVSFRALD